LLQESVAIAFNQFDELTVYFMLSLALNNIEIWNNYYYGKS